MEEFEELFVTEELARELQDKGFTSFDYKVFAHYESNGLVGFVELGESHDHLSAPLWQQAIDWLKKEKRIMICELWYGWEMGCEDEDFHRFNSREDALKMAIKFIQ